jgi:heat shock protein HtpX
MQMLKVFGLMTGLTLILVAIGGYFGGSSGMILMFAFAAIMNFGTYWFSDRAVLAMYKAQIIDRSQAPDLYNMVERLAHNGGVPMPVVAIAPSPQPNAFATGRSPEKGVVCFTQGILNALPMDELEGVTAHELAHIKHRHMLVGTIAATMAGAISMLAMMGRWALIFTGGGRDRDDNNPLAMLLMVILAPIAAAIIHMAISRQNEFQADRTGAQISGKPLGLARALKRLEAGAHQIPMDVNPAAAALAIVNPLAGRRGGMGLMGLFRTHPATEERVARLEALARGGDIG